MNRLMREIGPIAEDAPEFPLATGAYAPLGAAAEAKGSGDFSALWAGQSVGLGRALPAGELTHLLAREAQTRLAALGVRG
jgi:nitronate monooxygenase